MSAISSPLPPFVKGGRGGGIGAGYPGGKGAGDVRGAGKEGVESGISRWRYVEEIGNNLSGIVLYFAIKKRKKGRS